MNKHKLIFKIKLTKGLQAVDICCYFCLCACLFVRVFMFKGLSGYKY